MSAVTLGRRAFLGAVLGLPFALRQTASRERLFTNEWGGVRFQGEFDPLTEPELRALRAGRQVCKGAMTLNPSSERHWLSP